jgi:hypothetical protein
MNRPSGPEVMLLQSPLHLQQMMQVDWLLKAGQEELHRLDIESEEVVPIREQRLGSKILKNPLASVD